jgi:putative ABC transport system permease protein
VIPTLHDLRYVARSLRRSRHFAGITVLTLGLGVGAVTALFAVIDAVLLRPISVDQDRVVRIWKNDAVRGMDRHSISYREFTAWRDGTRSFEKLAAINYADTWSNALTIDGRPSPVAMTPVSADFFPVLHGGDALYGRWFQAADELPGAEVVGVVSERFWRRTTGGDPAFVGRRLTWAGGDRTLLVIGIAPAALDYPLGTDMWVPIARFFDGVAGRFDFNGHQFIQFEVLGRLARDASPDRAGAELEVISRQWSAQFPDNYRPMRVVVRPILDTVVGNGRHVLLFLFAAASLVFVIAGVNVAALLLMRASDRRKEMAVRVALGASRARLARQTVTEGLLLGGLGALCGLLIAALFLGIVKWLAPGDVPRIEHASLDLRVLGFCVVAVLVWVLALGTVPVWDHRRLEPSAGAGSLQLSFRTVRGTRGLRLFTLAQIAAAVVVAIGAGLLVRSFVHLQGVDRGFNSHNLVVISFLLPESRYPDTRARLAFYDRLLPQLDSIPGVISASPIHMGPGTGTVGLSAPMMFEGQTPHDAEKNPWASWDPITPSYFRTLGVAILRGRGFTDADSRTAQPVAIVSEAVARRYWPGQDALGKRLRLASEFSWVTVVGVAADLRYRELTRSWLTVYFPASQFFFFSPGSLVVRTASAPEALVPAIRETIRAQEPDAAVESIASMDALLARELSRPRTALTVTALFALMAIVLAAVGVYGVMSYEVHQRRRELAVRSALGASPAQIFRAIAWRSLTLGVFGAVAGLVAASAVTRSLSSLLFEVEPADPGTFLAGAGVLLGIVLIASYFPARRAAGADPVAVLRAE